MKRMDVTMNDVGDLTLLFTSYDSPPLGLTLFQSEVADLTPLESFRFLCEKIHVMVAPQRGAVITEIVDTGHVVEIELDGDEDDEDLSLFEEVVESPYEYLKDKGII